MKPSLIFSLVAFSISLLLFMRESLKRYMLQKSLEENFIFTRKMFVNTIITLEGKETTKEFWERISK